LKNIKGVYVEELELVGGSITAEKPVDEKPAKAKKPAAKAKSEEPEEKEELKATKDKPAAKAKSEEPTAAKTKAAAKSTAEKAKSEEPAASKTKTVAAQRANKSSKPSDDGVPDNVKALLEGSGDIFAGKSIVVTGVPPVIGRKNADKLVELYGGNIVKAISGKTAFVVLGNDAGPAKLQQIEKLNIKTYTDEEFVAMIEKDTSAGGGKRAADDDEDDEDTKPAKAKKAKK